HLMYPCLGRDDHVLGHSAVVPAKTEHVVRAAHPIPAPPAVHALLARHDLLPGDPVADRHAMGGQCLITAGNDLADELVPGNDSGHHPTVPAITAPELRGAVVTLQVTGAYAHGVDLQQQLIGFRLGHRPFFEAVI